MSVNRTPSVAPFLFLAAMFIAPTCIATYRAFNGGPVWPVLLGSFAVLSNVAFAIRAWRRGRAAT